MIYISNTQNTTIITDNFVSFIPLDLTIYFDDILVGTYTNQSNTTLYLKFEIPLIDVETYQEREYKMKITNYSATIKEELIIVKNYNTTPIVEVNETNNIIFYEG